MCEQEPITARARDRGKLESLKGVSGWGGLNQLQLLDMLSLGLRSRLMKGTHIIKHTDRSRVSRHIAPRYISGNRGGHTVAGILVS